VKSPNQISTISSNTGIGKQRFFERRPPAASIAVPGHRLVSTNGVNALLLQTGTGSREIFSEGDEYLHKLSPFRSPELSAANNRYDGFSGGTGGSMTSRFSNAQSTENAGNATVAPGNDFHGNDVSKHIDRNTSWDKPGTAGLARCFRQRVIDNVGGGTIKSSIRHSNTMNKLSSRTVIPPPRGRCLRKLSHRWHP